MVINKIIGTSVGADLSRPAPIYRPSMHVSISGLFCETSYSPATILLELVSGDDQFTRIQEEHCSLRYVHQRRVQPTLQRYVQHFLVGPSSGTRSCSRHCHAAPRRVAHAGGYRASALSFSIGDGNRNTPATRHASASVPCGSTD